MQMSKYQTREMSQALKQKCMIVTSKLNNTHKHYTCQKRFFFNFGWQLSRGRKHTPVLHHDVKHFFFTFRTY